MLLRLLAKNEYAAHIATTNGWGVAGCACSVSEPEACSKLHILAWIPVLVINVLGSVIIGAAVAWLSIDIKDLHLKDLTPTGEAINKLHLNDLTSLIVIGFCGAFTTFSSFSLDNFLLSINNKGQMLLNIFGTTLLAYGGVTFGWFLGSLAATS
jgi:fluoride ion exporter CrcB/FEX